MAEYDVRSPGPQTGLGKKSADLIADAFVSLGLRAVSG